MKTLDELRKERDKLDRKIFVAQTLAVVYGANLFSDEEIDEQTAKILNEVIREVIRDNAER